MKPDELLELDAREKGRRIKSNRRMPTLKSFYLLVPEKAGVNGDVLDTQGK